MSLLLNPRVWLALAFAAVLTFAGIHLYRAGEASVQDKWDHQIAIDKAAALAATQENQRIAARWNAQTLGAINDAKTREASLRADLSRASDERGRLLVAIQRATSRGVPGSPANAKPEPPNPLADVLRECTAEVQELAGDADGHASDVQTMMQAWPKP